MVSSHSSYFGPGGGKAGSAGAGSVGSLPPGGGMGPVVSGEPAPGAVAPAAGAEGASSFFASSQPINIRLNNATTTATYRIFMIYFPMV